MISRRKILIFSLVLATICLFSSSVARADTITSNTIVVTQGTIGGGVSDSVSAGTFTFMIPSGHTITAASIIGSAQYQLQSGAQIGLVLDGNLAQNISGLTASTPISISLNPSTFSTFADGTSIFTLNRLGGTFGGSYNLFNLQLQFTTQGAVTAPVPEPATMLLFGTGVMSLVGAAWKKRKSIDS